MKTKKRKYDFRNTVVYSLDSVSCSSLSLGPQTPFQLMDPTQVPLGPAAQGNEPQWECLAPVTTLTTRVFDVASPAAVKGIGGPNLEVGGGVSFFLREH